MLSSVELWQIRYVRLGYVALRCVLLSYGRYVAVGYVGSGCAALCRVALSYVKFC